MDDGGHAVLRDQAGDQRLVAGLAGDQRDALAIAHRKPVDRLSSTTTRSPASTRAWTMWLPIYPAPPVTRIVMGLARGLFAGVLARGV